MDQQTALKGNETQPASTEGPARRRPRWLPLAFLDVWGPGLVVMLADTDAGSLITAAQSGAQWATGCCCPR